MTNETPAAAPAATAPDPSPASAEAKITVRVVQQAVQDGGIMHLKNQVFDVTPERAKELGDFVVVVPPPAPAKAPTPPPLYVVAADELSDGGKDYKKGDPIALTPERVAALGQLVEVAK